MRDKNRLYPTDEGAAFSLLVGKFLSAYADFQEESLDLMLGINDGSERRFETQHILITELQLATIRYLLDHDYAC